ncbi:MAG: hypothetical protein HGA66_13620 [Holophaga sp.]|nr:hypothetical protein [Holophaga sp.]
MGFKRNIQPKAFLAGDDLTRALVGIGILFTGAAAPEPNIEDTLLAASVEGLEREDLRVLAVLVTWLEVHHAWLNADRLVSLVEAYPGDRVRAFWCAMARFLVKDRRLTKLAKVYKGPELDLLTTGTVFHIHRSGEDPRFMGGPLRVPAGILRDRKTDVLRPSELAARHRGYRRRVLLGPSYRADIWAELDGKPDSTPTELARRTYASFATAWQVKRDWELLGAGAAGP